MRWFRTKAFRWTLLAVVCLGLFASVFVVFAAQLDRQHAGDARSTRPGGNAAISQLLRDEGVTVRPETKLDPTLAEVDGDETLVVTASDRLDPAAARQLVAARPAVLVLVDPGSAALEHFELAVRSVPDGTAAQVPADCTVPAATKAESIAVTGASAYASDEATETCFPSGEGHLHVEQTLDTGTRLVVVGSNFTNRELADDGNAAYAMNLLGSQPEVVWFLAESAGTGTSSTDDAPGLLPDWWLPAVAQVVLAVAVIAVWRGRRLGPLMSENLPVVIPASETVEGHGRLYDRQHASEHAAEALRAGARQRLSSVLGHAADPQALSQVVAERTGYDVQAVHWLLAGPAPADDEQLHSLNQQLKRLEQEARQP